MAAAAIAASRAAAAAEDAFLSVTYSANSWASVSDGVLKKMHFWLV